MDHKPDHGVDGKIIIKTDICETLCEGVEWTQLAQNPLGGCEPDDEHRVIRP